MTGAQSSSPSQVFRVEQPRAADYLLDPRRGWRFFWPLLAAEYSAAQLGRLVQAPLNQVHYHLRLMLHMGLIAVTRVQGRAGRPIKFYRATFTACYVPFEHTSEASLEALVVRNDTLWTQWQSLNLLKVRRAAHPRWGWYCGLGPSHSVLHELRPDGAPQELSSEPLGVLDRWALISMGETEAQALQLELDALISRYLSPHPSGPQPAVPKQSYLLRVALSPSELER